MKLTEAISIMVSERLRRRSEATQAFHEQNGRYLVAFFGDRETSEFAGSAGYRELRRYVAEEGARGLSGHSIDKRLCTLKMALDEAVRHDALAVLPPWPDVDREYTPRETYLTRDEYSAIRKILQPHRCLWLDLGVWTGQHSSDIETMTWGEHIQRKNGAIWWLRRNTKNGTTPLWYQAAPALDEALRSAPGIGGPIVGRWDRAARDLTAACRKAGIEKQIAPIDLRRTCATWLAESGIDKEVVRELLGHSPGSVTLEAVYSRVTPRMREVLADVR